MRSASEHDRQMVALANEALAQHVIVSRSKPEEETRWFYVLSRPKTGVYLAEIRRVYGGRILVHGDIAGHLFQCTGADTPEETLRWLSGSDASYIASKAKLGEKDTFDIDVAIHELQERVSERSHDTPEAVAACEAIAILKGGGSIQEARQHIYDETGDGEWSSGLGVVVSPDVYYSMAACRRLLSLLEAEDRARAEIADMTKIVANITAIDARAKGKA